jgi:large subunit ribosomal protein L23
MDLSRVILGSLLTEKAERQKASRTLTLKVAPEATKVDVKAALRRFYDTDAANVRVIRVRNKMRASGRGGQMEKRAAYKKALVTLKPEGKIPDLASFKLR